MVSAYGAEHVGIGTDMDGVGRSTLPSYAEFAVLPRFLGKRGLMTERRRVRSNRVRFVLH